jgi:hypothetical protein
MNPAPRVYIPGYRWCKAAMALAGIAMFAFGMAQLWPPLRLLLFGSHANAEAAWVVKTREGLPPVILNTDAEIQAQRETRDRTPVFWNEFKFTTEDGRTVTVRPRAGSQLGPLYPLLDEDGLPTTLTVFYDPGDPRDVAFPLIVSTWLTPALIALGGVLATVIGAILFSWANTPIEMPHIPTPAELESTHRRESSAEE